MSRATKDVREIKEQLKRLLEDQARVLDMLKALISSRSSNGAARGRDSRLLKAALEGDLKRVRELLEAGAHANARNSDGESALLLAAYKPRNLPVVRELLRRGADPNLSDNEGNTALLVSVRDDELDVVRELVRRRANVNARSQAGDTPLTNAAAWGSYAVSKYLLKSGADPNLADGEEISAAELARQQGHAKIAQMIERQQA